MIHKLYEIKSPDGQSTARVLSSTALPPLKSNKRAGTYTSFDKLRADLSQQTRLCEKSFNLISNINEQLSPSNGFTLNRLIGSYTTAFSKFLDILLEKKPNENGKKLLAQKCRIYITGNTSTLNMIDEFEQTYENQNAIWWYTRDGFLFRLLNRTFRQENIQMIIYLHFFLFDLHQQLTVTYQSSNPRTGIEKYFRGQTMELEEIKKLEKNIFTHRSVTLNSFLSTTKDYGMALVYAGSGSYEKDDELQSVVFTINIARSNINSKDTEYADVEHLSYFPSEKETLFAVGSLFEIDTIEYNQNEKIWLITLFSWDEGNYETCCTVTSQLRPTTIDKKIIDAGRLLSEKTVKYNIFALFDLFAKDLIEGQFDAPVTEESFDTVKTLYYDILLETSLIDEFVYNVGVGSLAFMCERFDTAIQYLLTALTIENQNQIKDKEDVLILLYDTLGHVHKEKCLYNLALQYYTESVKLVTTEQSLADLASIYKILGNYERALAITSSYTTITRACNKHQDSITNVKEWKTFVDYTAANEYHFSMHHGEIAKEYLEIGKIHAAIPNEISVHNCGEYHLKGYEIPNLPFSVSLDQVRLQIAIDSFQRAIVICAQLQF
ncbi:unnamed protein product [Rotaria magnacalcarata]|uniref:Tetratricopeptide repeat protein n=1 Tax=Rotaria magnacalcarata TaxID=392030 RepID=A0A814SZT3_9BILA|nr:unnamed protein product [Rotaria magnacalcarata]CAF1451224.1 unnamed protein product [Rotaria magnacalcarata]